MKKSISRRSFIKGVAAGAALPLLVPRRSFAVEAPKLRHASIGTGGQASYDLESIFSSGKVEMVALCDIDEATMKKKAEKYPNARLYRDWREMLEKEAGNIDSVNVSTPDHIHAPASISAIRKGLHVYCEKPLTHNVYEARKVRLAAQKAGVVTQMGNQIHSHIYYRTAVHWLKEGAIGKVKSWHSWSGASFTTADKLRPKGEDPIPASVDWDLWLGVAPERPFKTDTYHPFKWRTWRDFGGGAVGDFGCHIFDPVFTALDIGAPLSLVCESECVSDEVYPAWTIAHYVFPGTPLTAGETINGSWMDGGKQPDTTDSPHLPKGYKLPGSGSMLIGEEGTMIIPHVGEPVMFPEAKFASYPKPNLDEVDHYHQFVDAALGHGSTGSHFAYAAPMTEAVLLANIGNRYPGTTLEWETIPCRFKGNDEATKLLRRAYRDGWHIDGLG